MDTQALGLAAKALARRPYLQPEDFGAAADGVTDDTAALQAAINAASAKGVAAGINIEVRLTGAQYKSGSLTPLSNVTITGSLLGTEGTSNAATRIIPNLTAGQYLFNQTSAISNFRLAGIHAAGPGVTLSVGGINITNGTCCSIDACNFSNWGMEAVVLGGGNNRVNQTSAQGLFYSGYLTQQRGTFTLTGGDHQITNCEWAGPSQNAVSSASLFAAAVLDGSFDALYQGCVFQTGDYGLYRQSGARTRFVGCRFDTNAGHGSGGGAASDSVFSGCTWSRNSYSSPGNYDHIFIPSGGPSVDTYIGPHFNNNTKNARYSINDAKSSGTFHNTYIMPGGEAGASGFYNLTGNSKVVLPNAGNNETLSGATPSVLNAGVVNTNNGSATTITNLLNGVTGQVLYIYPGDSNTTIQNNANIQNKAGADLLLTAGQPVAYQFVSAKWRQLF